MRKREIEKLLYKAVADALGVEVNQGLESKASRKIRPAARRTTVRQPERAAA